MDAEARPLIRPIKINRSIHSAVALVVEKVSDLPPLVVVVQADSILFVPADGLCADAWQSARCPRQDVHASHLTAVL